MRFGANARIGPAGPLPGHVQRAGLDGRRACAPRPPHGSPASRATVLLLGLTSMLTDISSEMVAAVLPLYLVFWPAPARSARRGRRPLPRRGGGVQVASGFASDRRRRHKQVATPATGSPRRQARAVRPATRSGAIAAMITVDRIGKGIRTAPRDALISLSSPSPRPFLRRASGDGHDRRDDRTAYRLRHPGSRRPPRFDAVFVVSTLFAFVLGPRRPRPDRPGQAPGGRRARGDAEALAAQSGEGAAARTTRFVPAC